MTLRFPCAISAAESQGDVEIEWTLELVTPAAHCFGEFDGTILAHYTVEDGGVAWECLAVVVEPLGEDAAPPFKITAESDPVMWAALERIIKADYEAITRRVEAAAS